MTYEVHTTVFEGPFDLLLHLILNEQVELYEVSLSRIVDAYLAELEKLEGLDLEVATEFLLIAATLVELKARRLLPGDDDVEVDDEFSLWEERDLLLARWWSARRSRTQLCSCRPSPTRPGVPSPARPDSTSATSTWRRTCWPASPRGPAGRVRPGPRTPSRSPAWTWTTWPRRGSRHRGGGRTGRRAAPPRAHHLPVGSPTRSWSASTWCAVPGCAGALQAGHDRPRPAHHLR
jgi:hypothetical protein